MKRVAPPPSDEQLAAAERTDNVRRLNREAQIEDEQEQERLALAGEPTAKEAIKAMASVIDSRPVGEEEPTDDNKTTAQTSREVTPPINRKPRKTKPRDADHRKSEASESPPPQEEEHDEAASQSRDEKLAYKLMDTAYKKWAKTAEKDFSKANRALAIDLGKDTMLYIRSGIIRMNDLQSTIDKLTASSKAGKDNSDAEDNFDEEMEEFRQQLRDGK